MPFRYEIGDVLTLDPGRLGTFSRCPVEIIGRCEVLGEEHEYKTRRYDFMDGRWQWVLEWWREGEIAAFDRREGRKRRPTKTGVAAPADDPELQHRTMRNPLGQGVSVP